MPHVYLLPLSACWRASYGIINKLQRPVLDTYTVLLSPDFSQLAEPEIAAPLYPCSSYYTASTYKTCRTLRTQLSIQHSISFHTEPYMPFHCTKCDETLANYDLFRLHLRVQQDSAVCRKPVCSLVRAITVHLSLVLI